MHVYSPSPTAAQFTYPVFLIPSQKPALVIDRNPQGRWGNILFKTAP